MSNVETEETEHQALARYFDAISKLPGYLAISDLSSDPLLKKAPRESIDGHNCPIIGGIPLLTKLGQGSFSAVYFAIHPMDGRNLAMRILPLPASPKNERFQCFMTDVKRAAEVRSSSLIEIIDFGIESGIFYMTLEHLDGKSAQEHLDALKIKLKPGMEEVALLDLCISAATGLAEAHSHGFLHRDIRPTSFIIPFGMGDALNYAAGKLNDLGLAFNENTACLLAGSQAESGTPGLMSPEQASGAELRKSSDVFSFGATIYTLLIGQPPFGGLSLNSVLSATLIQDVDDIRTWRPDISRATARVVQIALQKQPTRRFADASVLLSALRLARNSVTGSLDTQLIAMRAIDNLVPPSNHETNFVPKSSAAKSSGGTLAATPPAIESAATLISTRSKVSVSDATLIAVTRADTTKYPETVPSEVPLPEDAVPLPTASLNGSNDYDIPRNAEKDAELVKASIARLRALSAEDAERKYDAAEEWIDPTQTEEAAAAEEVSAGSGSTGRAVAVLALLLAAGGLGAWKMGWLNSEKKTPTTVVAHVDPPPVTSPTPTPANLDPKPVNPPVNPPVLAKPDPNESARLAEEKARLEREAQAKARLEAEAAEEKARKEREAAETKARLEREAAEAEEKARVKKEKEAAETAERAKKDKEEAAAKEKARIEKEAAEAEASARAQREAEAKARAEREAEAARAEVARKEKEAAAAAALAAAEAARQNNAPEIVLDLGGAQLPLLRVAGGKFNMGTNAADLLQAVRALGSDESEYRNEVPAHPAICGNFYISRTPVTVAQFRRFTEETGFKTAAEKAGEAYTLVDGSWQRVPGACWSKPGFPQTDNDPVVFLNANDCEAFAAWAAKKTGKPLRLPTEAEWEYAARGKENSIFPWGNQWDGRFANHADVRLRPLAPANWNVSPADDGFAFTSPAGSFQNKSWCGALDMAGNVFQWTQSAFEPYPENPKAPHILIEPGDTRDTKRVLKGGSFLSSPADCRSAARRPISPRAISCEFGMRLVFTAN